MITSAFSPVLNLMHSAQAQMLYTQKVAGLPAYGGFEPCIAHQNDSQIHLSGFCPPISPRRTCSQCSHRHSQSVLCTHAYKGERHEAPYNSSSACISVPSIRIL